MLRVNKLDFQKLHEKIISTTRTFYFSLTSSSGGELALRIHKIDQMALVL